MKKFLQSKAKVLFLCLFVVLTCTACSNPRGSDGKTKVEQIIANETVQIERGKLNIDSVEDEKLKKEYEKMSDTDLITIQPSKFSQAFENGWFEGLVVWPIAYMLNALGSKTDAGIAIICVTILINLIVFLLTRKSQMSSQRMQEIQPELQRIQNKYADKTDDQSKMRMYQEQQELYKKYDIHPFGSMAVMFLQLPIMMGMYYATMRAAIVVNGTFLGVDLSGTAMQGFKTGQIVYIVIYVLMIICQLTSLKLPQLLKKNDDKKKNIKTRSYRDNEENQSPLGNSMNMTMYMSTAMIAFLYISWPIAMSFYWCVSSFYRICQQLVLHAVMNKDK